MHDDALHPPPDPSARHEPTDIDTRPLKIVAWIFAISAVVIPLALLLLFKHYEKTATHPDRQLVNSQVREDATPSAPEPRIQGVPAFHGNVPRADMDKLRRESDQRLHSYAKSEDPGFVRIPIDRAMQILAEQKMKPTTQKAQ
jgi:hypothetical protein